MVKKEVHESELLFLAQRTKRDSGAEGGGESEANVAVPNRLKPGNARRFVRRTEGDSSDKRDSFHAFGRKIPVAV